MSDSAPGPLTRPVVPSAHSADLSPRRGDAIAAAFHLSLGRSASTRWRAGQVRACVTCNDFAVAQITPGKLDRCRARALVSSSRPPLRGLKFVRQDTDRPIHRGLRLSRTRSRRRARWRSARQPAEASYDTRRTASLPSMAMTCSVSGTLTYLRISTAYFEVIAARLAKAPSPGFATRSPTSPARESERPAILKG